MDLYDYYGWRKPRYALDHATLRRLYGGPPYPPADRIGDMLYGELAAIIDHHIAHTLAERNPTPKPKWTAKPYELPQAIRNAVDHLVEQGDEVALRRFLQRFPKDQRAAVDAYAASRRRRAA